jgi:4-amino-4-deoxy-L-arabinose transferase-like glycosyltransferase
MGKTRFALWCIFILLAAFALRVWHLGGPSLWYDEAYLWWVTRLPLGEMLSLSMHELIPPLSYLLLRVWQPLAGTSEFALRFPSVFFGLLALAALARIARRLTGQRVAASWALLFGALATPLLWAARETRMYGAFIAWTLLAGMALIETLYAGNVCVGAHRVRRRWAWFWGGALFGALATLTLSAFWLAGLGLFALAMLLRRSWPAARAWLQDLFWPTLTAGALFLPWVIGALRTLETNATYWAGHLPIAEFLRITITGMTVSNYWPTASQVAVGGLLLLATFPALLLTRRRPHAGLYPLLYLLPVGAMALIFRSLPKWGGRHASFLAPLPVLALALGWGMAQTCNHRRIRVFARVWLGMCSLIFVVIAFRADLYMLIDPAYATEDWRSVARYVEEHRTPGDVVIVETGSIFPAWAYYAGFDGLLPLPDDELLDVNHVLHYGNVAPALNAALQEASGVWLVTWLDRVTDPTGIVPALLETLGSEVPTPQFHGLGLRHFTLERRADFPTEPPLTAQPMQPTLPGLTLWGYRLPETPQPAGSSLDVWAFWTADATAVLEDRFYQVVVRLLDARGDEWGRVNSTPGSGDYRPSRWPVDTPVLGRYTLTPDPWTPPGIYTPTLTVYLAGEVEATVTLQPVTLLAAAQSPSLPDRAASVEPLAAGIPTAPLRLLGLWIGRDTVQPCDQVEGWVYWESTADVVVHNLHMLVAVGDHGPALPVAPESADQVWPAGMRFAMQFRLPIACKASDVQAPLQVQLADASGAVLATWRGPLVSIVADRTFVSPEGILGASGDFGPGFAELVGYTLEPAPRAGTPFTVTLYWRAGETGDVPYSVFVHVTPPDVPATIIAQHDGWPALGAKPTFTWARGEIVADAHPLPGLPAGTYWLRTGFYNAAGRLPFYTDADVALEDAAVIPLIVAP